MTKYIALLVALLISLVALNVFAVNNQPPRSRVRMYLKQQDGHMRKRAAERRMTYALRISDLARWLDKPCTYCNSEVKGINLSPIEPEMEYTKGNMAQECKNCSQMKGGKSLMVWTAQMAGILHRLSGDKTK